MAQGYIYTHVYSIWWKVLKPHNEAESNYFQPLLEPKSERVPLHCLQQKNPLTPQPSNLSFIIYKKKKTIELNSLQYNRLIIIMIIMTC